MFTGIVRNFGFLKNLERNRITIQINHDRKINLGDSIACNGVCLTVFDIQDDLYRFDLSDETISKTTLSKLKIGTSINIEFSARIGDENGGHNVTGHVHGIGIVRNIEKNNNGWIFSFKATGDLFKYIVEKDSIAIDGISLTVSNMNEKDECFEISIISFTFNNTNLQNLTIGDFVNIEPNMDIVRIFRMMHNIKR